MSFPQTPFLVTASAMGTTVDLNSSSLPPTTKSLALIQMESIARLNNTGVAYLESGELSSAGQCLRRSLEKATEATFFAQQKPGVNMPNLEPKDKVYEFQRGEYDEGVHVYSSPVPIDPGMSSVHTATATILFNLGQLYLRLNNNVEALACFVQALQIASWDQASAIKSSATGGVRLLQILHNIGHANYRLGRYEDSFKTYSQALETGRESPSSSSSHHMLEVSSILNCLGVLHFHMPTSISEDALGFFEESLELKRAVLGADADTKEVATVLNNIGRVYYMKGDHNTAMEYYIPALNIRRRLFGDNHLDVAATVYNTGQTLHHLRESEAAMEHYEEFLAIAKSKLGYQHRDVAAMFKCMAQIHHECKNVDKATELYREAIHVWKAASGTTHNSEIASTLNKLGNLLYENGDLDTALQAYKEGLQVERSILNRSHPNIVVTLTNIGQIHKLRGEYDLALRVYKEAAAIQRESSEMTHPNISTTFSSIALIHYRTRNYTKALEVYQEALRIRREAFGDDNLEVASSLNSVGLVLYKMNVHEYALQSFHESLRIRRALLGPEHREVAIVLYNIATIHLESGADDEAMLYYRETLRVERAALGPDHPDVVLTIQHIGQVHQQRGELGEALEYFTEALDVQIREGDPDNVSVAKTLNHIGNVHLQRGQAKESVEAFSEALRRLRVAGKSESQLAVSGLNFYALSKKHPETAAGA